MAVATTTISINSGPSRVRPLDPGRDLGAVADLVELCFAGTMDSDGQGYLRQMRDTAREAQFWGWLNPIAEQSYAMPSGYVWEEGGRIVGNLSLFPFTTQGRRCTMIANVAVHPDFRGRGIGRALTTAALEHVRRRKLHAAWLQVRDDNPTALDLYRSLGFEERARRAQWRSLTGQTSEASRTSEVPTKPGGLVFGPRRAVHWPQQREWLARLYPAELSWHLPVNWKSIRPDWVGMAYRFFSLDFPRQWAIERGGYLLGTLTWQRNPGYTDTLWLAVPQVYEIPAVQTLLVFARRQLSPRRSLALNFPAGLATPAIEAAGFKARHTLIWMTINTT